jgi:hypothetical protein
MNPRLEEAASSYRAVAQRDGDLGPISDSQTLASDGTGDFTRSLLDTIKRYLDQTDADGRFYEVTIERGGYELKQGRMKTRHQNGAFRFEIKAAPRGCGG